MRNVFDLVEFGIVINRPGHNIMQENALNHIGGKKLKYLQSFIITYCLDIQATFLHLI